MPGSETALKELMCGVLDHLLEESIIARIADDPYYRENSPHEHKHHAQVQSPSFAVEDHH